MITGSLRTAAIFGRIRAQRVIMGWRVERVAHGQAQRIVLGELSIDPAERRVVRGDEPVHLTPIEFDLLLHLAGQPRTVLARDALLAKVWGWSHAGGTRTVDSHIKALRRKLGPGLIRTVHGVGYSAEPSADVDDAGQADTP